MVYSADTPYKVKKDGTVGRPPADPRHIAMCLLIKAIFCKSYRSVYSILASSREYREILGMNNIPGYNTVQEHVKDVPERYLTKLIRSTSVRIMNAQGRSACSSACDGTGMGTKEYQRWFNVRTKGKSEKKRFVKLHAQTTTDTEMPFFLSATVTKGYKHDSPRLEQLITDRSREIRVEEMSLDPGYLSRRNAQLIANDRTRPYIKLKKNTVCALSKGYPAWNRMVHDTWENKDEYEKHYHRRSVIEGIFSAYKHRFGRIVASRIRHNQNIEVLSRVVAWNILAYAYHSMP